MAQLSYPALLITVWVVTKSETTLLTINIAVEPECAYGKFGNN